MTQRISKVTKLLNILIYETEISSLLHRFACTTGVMSLTMILPSIKDVPVEGRSSGMAKYKAK